MDVDTLLTRQMELHTSVRHPPKTAEQLVQLHETMRNYHHYFKKLKSLAEQLNSDADTVFQCFMYISMGGAVSFDKQHQDGSVPMHQAKVLARTSAIKLEPAVREAIPIKELMVYVGLSKDLRTSLRVKMEDANDLVTAENSVKEAVEYLDCIEQHSDGDADRMFAFYMVEEADTLQQMLEESGARSPNCASAGKDAPWTDHANASPVLGASLTIGGDGSALARDWSFSGTLKTGRGVNPGSPSLSSSPGSGSPLNTLPTPLSSLPEELRRHASAAEDTKGNSAKRVKAAQTILDWLTEVPADYFAENIEPLLEAVGHTLTVLVAEKRSALCRVGCNTIALLIQRLADEPCLSPRDSNPLVVALLSEWTQTLCKGIFVTVAAISTSTDFTLRELVLCSRGHPAVVKAILAALRNGTQTELRRKCLGYLALSVVAAACADSSDDREEKAAFPTPPPPTFASSLVDPAQMYVGIGDSPSRKMARALCAVLRAVCHLDVPIKDPKTEKLIQMEKTQILPYLDDPREMERVLFETNDFVSSMRPLTASSSSPSRASSRPASSCINESRAAAVTELSGLTSCVTAIPKLYAAPVGQRNTSLRTILPSTSPDVTEENPAVYNSPKRGQRTKPLIDSGAKRIICAVPLDTLHPSHAKSLPKSPTKLPPINGAKPARLGADIYETSAPLESTGEEEDEEGDAVGVDILVNGDSGGGGGGPLGLTASAAAPLSPSARRREQQLQRLKKTGASPSKKERLLPLSLRPAGSNELNPAGKLVVDVPQRSNERRNTTPSPASRRETSVHSPPSSSKTDSLSQDGGRPSAQVPRLSDALRRKIEASQR